MIKDVLEFQPDRHEDFRGDIYTTWNNEDYPKLNWRLDKFAHSQKNVLRGLHGDFNTWKLISCVYGKFYYLLADNREDSPTYKQWNWWILSAENRKQILTPPGLIVMIIMSIPHQRQSMHLVATWSLISRSIIKYLER